MGSLFGSKKAPPMDYRWVPAFPTRSQMVQVAVGDVIAFGARGSAQWFNPDSASDRRLLVLLEKVPPLLETDSLESLSRVQGPEFAPHHGFVIYQNFPEPIQDGVRLVRAMFPADAEAMGGALKGGPTRHLILITAGFMRGSIEAVGKALDGHELETLGFFWYFSGDDVTDVPEYPDEIAEACRATRAKRLILLTGAWSASVDEALAQALATCPTLTACVVFEKDDAGRYPPFPSPKVDALLRGRAGAR